MTLGDGCRSHGRPLKGVYGAAMKKNLHEHVIPQRYYMFGEIFACLGLFGPSFTSGNGPKTVTKPLHVGYTSVTCPLCQLYFGYIYIVTKLLFLIKMLLNAHASPRVTTLTCRSSGALRLVTWVDHTSAQHECGRVQRLGLGALRVGSSVRPVSVTAPLSRC